MCICDLFLAESPSAEQTNVSYKRVHHCSVINVVMTKISVMCQLQIQMRTLQCCAESDEFVDVI